MEKGSINHPGGRGEKDNGKGVGNLPKGSKQSQSASMKAHENTDFDKKQGQVQRVVGD